MLQEDRGVGKGKLISGSTLSLDLRKGRTRRLSRSPNPGVALSSRLDATEYATHHTRAVRPTNADKTTE
jgi:hypothetical protein